MQHPQTEERLKNVLFQGIADCDFNKVKKALTCVKNLDIRDKDGKGLLQLATQALCDLDPEAESQRVKFDQLSQEIAKLEEKLGKLELDNQEEIQDIQKKIDKLEAKARQEDLPEDLKTKNAEKIDKLKQEKVKKEKEINDQKESIKRKEEDRNNLSKLTNITEIIKLLTKDDNRHILINQPDKSGDAPLAIAIKKGNQNAINVLVQLGANASVALDRDCSNAFIYAVDVIKDGDDLDLKSVLGAIAIGSAKVKDPGAKAKQKEITNSLIKYTTSIFENYKKSLDTLQKCDAKGEIFFHKVVKLQSKEAIEWLDTFCDEEKRKALVKKLIDNELKKYTGIESDEKEKIKDKITQEIDYLNKNFQKQFIDNAKTKILNTPDSNGDDLARIIAKNVDNKEFLETLLQVDDLKLPEIGQLVATFALYNNTQALNAVAPQSQNNIGFYQQNLAEHYADQSAIQRDESDRITEFLITNPIWLKTLVEYSDSDKENDMLSSLLDNNNVKIGSVLHFAIESGKANLVKKILESNTDIGLAAILNKDDLNPLEAAIKKDKAITETILDHINGEALEQLLDKQDAKTKENILHLTAKHCPNLLDVFLDKITNENKKNELLAVKNLDGKIPAQLAEVNAEIGEDLLPSDNREIFNNAEDLKLYNSAANGKLDYLVKIFDQNNDKLYKTFNHDGQQKSILEVAAENKQASVVQMIIAKHSQLQKKLKDINSQIDSLTIDINKLNNLDALTEIQESEKTYKANLKIDKEQEKDDLTQKIAALRDHARNASLKAIPNQSPQDWHQDIFDMSDLQAQVIENYIQSAKKNPLCAAIRSDNQVALELINNAYNRSEQKSPSELLEKRGEDDLQTPGDLLRQKGNTEMLLKHGLSTDGAYNSKYVYKSPSNAETIDQDKEPSKFFKENFKSYKIPLSDKINGKGELTQYADALFGDADSAERFKSALSRIEDKDRSLLKVGDDKSTIATLIAAFGSAKHWEVYHNKYSKLEAKDKTSAYACNDTTSNLGTPAQCALIAKYLAKDEFEKRSRQLLFNDFINKKQLDLCAQNGKGQNILHTIALCADFEALNSVIEKYSEKEIFSALLQKDVNGMIALEAAVAQGHEGFSVVFLNSLRHKLGNRQFLNILTSSNLLHAAILHKNVKVQKFILGIQKILSLEFLKDIKLENQKDAQSTTPFELAIKLERRDAIDAFLQENILSEKDKIKELLDQERFNISAQFIDYLAEVNAIDQEFAAKIKNEVQKSVEKSNLEEGSWQEATQGQNQDLMLWYIDPNGDIEQETNNGNFEHWLTQADIARIAQIYYRWDGEDFEVIGSIDQSEIALKDANAKLQNAADGTNFTAIINASPRSSAKTGDHWVTLVLAKQDGAVKAYYANSMIDNNDINAAIQQTFAKVFGDQASFINCECRVQQGGKDTYNCGVFAMQNAQNIIEGAKNHLDESEVKKRVQEYKPGNEDLHFKRREFAQSLEFARNPVSQYSEILEDLQSCKNLEEQDQEIFKKDSLFYGVQSNKNYLKFTKEQEELIDKINAGNIDDAKKIIEYNPQILTGQKSFGILDLAIQSQDAGLIRVCAQNCNHSVVDKNGNTFLHNAIISGQAGEELINMCLEKGASLLQKNQAGETPFDLLNKNQAQGNVYYKGYQEKQSADSIKLLGLLQKNLDISDINHGAIQQLADKIKDVQPHNFPNIVSLIVKECFKLENAKNPGIIAKRFELLNRLIKEDIPLNNTDQNGNNILHLLGYYLANSGVDEAKNHALNIIKSIKDQGRLSDLLFVKNSDGATPLEFFAQVGNMQDAWQFLNEQYKGLQDQERFDYTNLLFIAAIKKNHKLCEFFLREFYDQIKINAVDVNGDSLLLHAANNRDKEFLKLLVKSGANINQCDQFGRNALSQLLDRGAVDTEISYFLVERGIDLNSKDKAGNSVLDKIAYLESSILQQKDRLQQLRSKDANSLLPKEQKEKEGLEIIQDASYLETIKKAQEKRAQVQKEFKKRVQSSVSDIPSGKLSEFLYNCTHSAFPEAMAQKAYELKDNEFDVSVQGCELKIKSDKNLRINLDNLLSDKKQQSEYPISKIEASFGKNDKVTIEKHPKGFINYRVTQGSIIINAPVIKKGKVKEICLEIKSNGKIISKSGDIDKIDFSQSMIYVGGKRLEEVLKQGAWKKEGPDSLSQLARESGIASCGMQQSNTACDNRQILPNNDERARADSRTL